MAFLMAFGIDYLNKTDLAKISYTAESQQSVDTATSTSNSDEITILNFGDMMFGRQVGVAMANGLDPFESIWNSNLLKNADLSIANLEGPITATTTKCQDKAYSFKFDVEQTPKLLALNKISLVNLANNHSFDCYEKGLGDTRRTLDKARIGYFGGGEKVAGSSAELEVKGRKIGFVGINVTFNPNLDKGYLDKIKILKERGNFVIVNIHWGTEYSKIATESQKASGYALIDAGADVIIGHHPHVIEPLEIYNGKPIFYSLGNFIFDQIQPENNEGVGVKIKIDKDGRPSFEILPYRIKKMEPQLLGLVDAKSFCDIFLKNYATYRTGDCEIKI